MTPVDLSQANREVAEAWAALAALGPATDAESLEVRYPLEDQLTAAVIRRNTVRRMLGEGD